MNYEDEMGEANGRDRAREEAAAKVEQLRKLARAITETGKGPDATLKFIYMNHKRIKSTRWVIPIGFKWGSSKWHPGLHWIMMAWDIDKEAVRDFLLNEMSIRTQTG